MGLWGLNGLRCEKAIIGNARGRLPIPPGSAPATSSHPQRATEDIIASARRQAKATAIRGSGVLTRRLDALSETAGQLQKESARQEIEKERLLALQEVGAAINSSLDLDVVLQQVMDAIIRLTNAERAMLLLVNDGDLEVKIARNISQETLDNAASLEISHSIVRKVAESGEPIVSINAQEDERFALQHSIVSYKLRSIVCAPLKIKGETTGVIYADNRVASGIFSDTDRDLLAVFADQAAVAIDNARLFHEVAGMKHLMDNVFASIAGGVITIDENDRIALFNRAAERILGMSAEPLHLRTYQDVLSLLGLPVESLIHQAKEDGQTHSAELDLGGVRRRNSPVTVNVTVSPLSTVDNERVGGVAIVIDDVSEKKRVESLRRYLPPALVDRVRDLDAAQKPQRRPITVMFADIRDFSRFGEHVDPEELIDLANGLFSERWQPSAPSWADRQVHGRRGDGLVQHAIEPARGSCRAGGRRRAGCSGTDGGLPQRVAVEQTPSFRHRHPHW